MRALRFDFHPERVQISAAEIQADLRYPARPERSADREQRRPDPRSSRGRRR